MKRKLLLASLFAVAISPNVAQANDIGVAICQSVIGNDKHGLRLALRSGGFKLRSIYEDLRCNDKSLVQLAFENEATDIGTYIISKVSKSTLEKVGDLTWADANGYSGSPIYADLKSRME